jgi:tetratricopeptide (TPR) repeat protein
MTAEPKESAQAQAPVSQSAARSDSTPQSAARSDSTPQSAARSDNTPLAVPDIDEAFRARVNAVFDGWQGNKISFQETLKQLEAFRQEAVSENNGISEAAIYNILGIIYGYRANYDESINNFTKARDLFDKHEVKRRVASCDLNLGETYRLRSNFTKARQYFHSAYEAAKSLENISMQTIALTNEGQMWVSLKSYDKGKKCLEEALDLAINKWVSETEREKMTRMDNLCEIHSAFVTLYLLENNSEKAWENAKHTHDYAMQIDRPIRFGYANRAMGDVVSLMGRAPEDGYSAEPDEYYQAALEAFRQVKADAEVGKTLFAQGQSLAKRGKTRSAGQKLQQAMVIFTKQGMMEDAAKAAEAQMSLI